MIASYTQTYGEDRILELMLLKYDKIGNYFRSKCDKIIFCFHNCSDIIIEEGKKLLIGLYPKDKLIIMKQKDVSYKKSVINVMNFLKERSIEQVLMIQDDQYCVNGEKFEVVKRKLTYIDEIFDFIDREKPKHLKVFRNESDPKVNGLMPVSTVKFMSGMNIYQYMTSDFKRTDIWSWNDGTYFSNVEYLHKLLSNVSIGEDVWRVEWELKKLWDNSLETTRWGVDVIFFSALNMHGRSVSRSSVEKKLYNSFHRCKEWKEIEKMAIKYF